MKATFPYPPKELNPNRKLHWAVKAKAVKKYRTECRYIAQAADFGLIEAEFLDLVITIHPPDKRRRDKDNVIASLKAMQDAIADVTEIDDSRFDTSYRMREPIRGGAIKVEIKENDNERDI